ncbi:MAG TPA: DNA-protecting protein DprA, partial [Alphaproteobacteria bacterium]|nr:DNA-protecting protein DprA [Alphaproteobacteria bacterium]
AGEQGREVFAVPGSPLDPRCRGSNGLIRQGALLTESADDVLEALAPLIARSGLAERWAVLAAISGLPEMPAGTAEILDDGDVDGRLRVTTLLGPSPVEVDELVRQAQLTPAAVMTILLELELAGRLHRHAGNRVSIS